MPYSIKKAINKAKGKFGKRKQHNHPIYSLNLVSESDHIKTHFLSVP
jgi:hypothetical protein